MSNSCKNTRYGTPRHGGPAICHVIHVIHVSPCPWVCGGGLLQTEGEGRSVTSVSFVPLLQITPAGGRRHGRGGARTRLPLPAPTTATSRYWILTQHQLFKISIYPCPIHPASLYYLDIGSLCVCVVGICSEIKCQFVYSESGASIICYQ